MSEVGRKNNADEISASADAAPEESHEEFIVHTKHTCDGCFRLPIVGKRYTSSARPNYDLCASCFDTYSGPDIGLADAVLLRDKKASSEFVMKLKVDNRGDEQIRRINVSEVWDGAVSGLSFGKMMSVASSYAFPGEQGLATFMARAKATYIDDDGDKITFSSDAELYDAFHQALKKSKPFRITVTIPKDEPIKVGAEGQGMPTRIQKNKATLRVTPKKFEKEFFIHGRHTCDGCNKNPIVGTRYHATKIPDFDLCAACFKNYEGEDLDFKPEIDGRDRCRQQKWLKKQLCNSATIASDGVAGVWTKANGELSNFLEKIQQGGATIESATVYACPSAKNGSTSKPNGREELTSFKDVVTPPQEQHEPIKQESAKTDAAAVKSTPKSPIASHDEAFLSDADGNGSIAEAIGRTLDVCFAAMEEAMVDEEERSIASEAGSTGMSQKTSDGKVTIKDEVAAAAVAAADALSVASSVVSGMTEVVRKMEQAKKEVGATQTDVLPDDADAFTAMSSEVTGMTNSKYETASQKKGTPSSKVSVEEEVAAAAVAATDAFSVASSMVSRMSDVLCKMEELKNDDGNAPTTVPSKVTGTPISRSAPATEEKKNIFVMPEVEHASDGEDDWSVVYDDKAQTKTEEEKPVTSTGPLSPVVLAKWDTELRQLHELGFYDDRKNIDVLEALEASHVAVNSEERVTINAALERLLGDR